MSGAKYDVMSQTIEALFSQGTAQFKVPPFQRRYAWGSEEISQLMDDLFGDLSNTELPYFLGSIVLARQDGFEPVPDIVLDGQQRLTTLSLLVACLIHKMRASGSLEADEHKAYLFSRRIEGKRTPKVLLQPDDAKVFATLIDDPEKHSDHQIRHTRLGEAVNKIFDLLDEFAAAPSYNDKSKPYDSMLARLLYHVELVRITAPTERDAFRLFETLNDRGLALSAADLIKNKLFSRCKDKDELDAAVEAWSNLLLNTKDDDVVSFLRSHWIAFKGFARKLELYDVYKKEIDHLDSTNAALFVFELEETSKLYIHLVTPNPTTNPWGLEVALGLDRLSNSYHARSCRPALLAFAKLRPNDMERAVKLCESITVRYSVVGGKNPNRLEWLYSQMCAMLREEKEPWARFKESDMFDEVPDDEEFRTRLATMEISTLTAGWREVLVHLNRDLGRGEARLDFPSRVHVEHILPQTPRATALTEAALTQEQAADLVSRLGNLTLLSGRRNQQISNRPFSGKRDAYAKSDVFLTRELAELTRWTGDDIDRRSHRLAEVAVNLFPNPKRIASG
jgi:Protein of unknown function DUF262/Protein of unknown function (DUF1524)